VRNRDFQQGREGNSADDSAHLLPLFVGVGGGGTRLRHWTMSLWMARLSLSNSSLLSLSRCSWRVIDLPTARDALPPTPPPPDQAAILALLCLALLASSSLGDCGAPACCCPTAPASPCPGPTPKIPPYAAASAMPLPATQLSPSPLSSLLASGFSSHPPLLPLSLLIMTDDYGLL
jgi:hypothetical protein